MSWDDEKRVQHFKDVERILKREIHFQTKQEMKFHPMKDMKDIPPAGPTTFRHFTRVIPREEWGAIPAIESLPPLTLPIHKIHYSFHRNWPTCTTQEACTLNVMKMQLREINERGLPDVRHNFMMGFDCSVYEGRGWNYAPEKPWDVDPKMWDEQSLDIGLFGETTDHSWPYEEMFTVLKELISIWKQQNLVTDNYLQI